MEKPIVHLQALRPKGKIECRAKAVKKSIAWDDVKRFDEVTCEECREKGHLGTRWLGPDEVEAGMPATLFIGSDRYGYKVVDKSETGKTIKCIENWECATVETFRWSEKRKCYVFGIYQLRVGKSDPYQDPHF